MLSLSNNQFDFGDDTDYDLDPETESEPNCPDLYEIPTRVVSQTKDQSMIFYADWDFDPHP